MHFSTLLYITLCFFSVAYTISIKRPTEGASTAPNNHRYVIGSWANAQPISLGQCRPVNSNKIPRSSHQLLLAAKTQPDIISKKVFAGGYTDVNGAHVDLQITLNKNGRVDLVTGADKSNLLKFTELALSPVYNQVVPKPNQGWYINVHDHNECQHDSLLQMEQVVAFTIKYD